MEWILFSLHEAGLRIQLGHDGAKCISPISEPPAFTVTDLSGVHCIAVDFCDCCQNGIVPRHIQFLRAGWFPATLISPKMPLHFAVSISTMS